MEVVLDAHEALLSHADPEGWVRTQLEALDGAGSGKIADTPWGRYLMSDAKRKAIYWREVLWALTEEAGAHPEFMKAYGDSLSVTLTGLDGFIAALDRSWDEARALADIEFPRAKSLKGYDDMKEIRTRSKEALKKTAAVFECTAADLAEDIAAVSPAVRALLELVMEFDAAYCRCQTPAGHR
jgi:ATP-dependent helicase/nuclease subunit A